MQNNLPFQTTREVDNYLSGDTIACLVCGKRFQALRPTHLRLHGLTHAEYRRRFGIPPHRPLASAPSLARSRAEGRSFATTRTTVPCVDCGCEIVTTRLVALQRLQCRDCAPARLKPHRDAYWRKKVILQTEKEAIAYPAFETTAEIDDYLSGDTITCLICDARLQRLDPHLRIHGISADEYRARFAIPFDRSLISAPCRAKIHANLARFSRISSDWREPIWDWNPDRRRTYEAPDD